MQTRTIELIHQEYSSLCAKAGHLQYSVVTLQKDLDLLNEQLRELNLEAAKVQAEQQAAASAAAKPVLAEVKSE